MNLCPLALAFLYSTVTAVLSHFTGPKEKLELTFSLIVETGRLESV